MKALLQLLLVHYYADGKRSTSAKITRPLDTKIRGLIEADPSLASLVIACKKTAEALKRQVRDADRKTQKMMYFRRRSGVEHVPCGKGKVSAILPIYKGKALK